jgi:hypothetical protein
MQKVFDKILLWLKWPVAVASLICLPGLVLAWSSEVLALTSEEDFLPVAAGVLGYGLLWAVLFRRRGAGSFLPTFFHELTHGLFAVLTFHRVGGLRASWSSGGRIAIHGGTNWLILIGPYFFPLAPALAAALVLLGPPSWLKVGLCGFGASLAFYGFSLYAELHRKQTDLQEVGFPFVWLCLPGANLLVIGSLVTGTLGGPTATAQFLSETYSWTEQIVSSLF